MKARVVGIRPALGAVVGAEVVAIAAFASLPPYRFGWWPMAAITAAAVILLLVTVYRRNAVRWRPTGSDWCVTGDTPRRSPRRWISATAAVCAGCAPPAMRR